MNKYGMLINMYGQVLVPTLRGTEDVLSAFMLDCVQSPMTAFLSIGTGFLFPWMVSAYAGARARVEVSATASLARFPDLKPDPVFRTDLDGIVIEAGAQTRVMFDTHRIERAQDVLGADLWARIVESVQRDGSLSVPETAYFAAASQWYVVTASAAPPDGINVYLTVLPRDGVRGASPDTDRKSA